MMDTDSRSLYDEALARFRKDAAERHSGSKDLELLNEFLRERATPEETKQAAQVLQGDAGKKYGGRKLGEVEIPESWIANIMGNIENFVAAGDFVTKNAPESVGMAWYAIKLTLTAIHSNYDLYTFFGAGLSDISEIMIIVRHYDRLYDERSKPQWKPSPLVEKLFQDVIGAYAAVLDFSFAIKRHLTAGALTRIKHGFKDFFGMSKVKFQDKLDTVSSLKKKILEESQGVFQNKTLSQLQGVSTVLAGIEGTVRYIRDFQDTQKKLQEEAVARFDALLKGLDDIKASTKRKTQWDYAVQDFQGYQEALSPLEGCFAILGDAIDAIYPGTCQWVFEEPLYKQWAEGSAMLCITGLEGSGKSYVVASIADRITGAGDPDSALLYVTCGGGSASGAGLGSNQSYTADSVCRTLLAQLYELAVQGEDNVGLLEACNTVFKKAKAKASGLPTHKRGDSPDLPEFADGFSRIAALLKKDLTLILDGIDRNALEDRDQEELLRKLRALMMAALDNGGIRLRVLVGCASSTKFFNDLDLAPSSYIDVQDGNSTDMDLVLTDALRDVPGLSAAEQEVSKAAILEKARSRFLYIRDTAIPFMREPFQRPLSKRLEALPDGASDVYSKALSKMSPNYLALLRTALTWTLLAPVYPGLPFAREVMDAFQGTYDIPPEADLTGETEGFPLASRLELEQLRGATDPFLKLFPNPDGSVLVVEADAAAAVDFFMKSAADPHEEEEDDEHLCARCGSSRLPAKALHIDLKEGHLQMALTCLRHLNHPLFQRRAGLVASVTENSEDIATGNAGSRAVAEDCNGPDDGQSHDDEVEYYLQQAQDGYHTEDSIDDEDVAEPGLFFDRESYDAGGGAAGSGDDVLTRVRYEIQYFPFHFRHAEHLWPAEEREKSADWAALMNELDKLVFETPEVFAAWQAKYPEKDFAYDAIFRLDNGPHKPLHVAAYLGLASWAEHLLGRGEQSDELSEGFSALQAAACSGGELDTVKLLLNRGADINAENGAGLTAFQHWLLRGEITVDGVRTFLDNGADPNLCSARDHFSAVHYFASRGEDPEVLDLLLAHGADINALDPKNKWRYTGLHLLLMRGEVPRPLLQAFIKHNADTNAEDVTSSRPLQIVCHNGELENLKILLQSEVLDIDDTDHEGTTAVHEAAFYNDSSVVRALLEKGADPDIPDKLGRVALHSAARKGLVESVRVLLEYSKQVNLLDKHGWTPLFCACLSKKEGAALSILDALIERNVPLAEINKSSRSGRSVLRQAADHGFDGVVSKLIQLAQDQNSVASLAIDAIDSKKGMTALHRAAINGRAACVRALLAANPPADVTLKDSQSRTALTLAHEQWSVATKKSSYEEIISLLITAAPAAATADADLIAVCAANGSVALLEQLSFHGASLTRPDRFGWTPLDLARQFARAEAEAFLKQRAAATARAEMLPSRWETKFPGTIPATGAASVGKGGRKVKHTSGRRVCVSADRPVPLPVGVEGYYFEVTLREVEVEGEREGVAEAADVGAGPEQDKPDGKGGAATTSRSDTEEESTQEYPEMAIGFCTLGGAALEFPGWWAAGDSPSTARSWGYHSDTGGVYSSLVDMDEPFEDRLFEEWRYRVGDTVGCGVDLGKGEIWFTKNGVRLDRAVKGAEGRLFPVVGLHEEVCFETNFGREGDPAFRWQPEAEHTKKESEADGSVVKVVVVGDGKDHALVEKDVVRVTTEEVVVVAQ